MTELRDLIEARLREVGLKLTPQRFAVQGNSVAILGHSIGSLLGLPTAEETKLTL